MKNRAKIAAKGKIKYILETGTKKKIIAKIINTNARPTL
jgi:hypothetical protein